MRISAVYEFGECLLKCKVLGIRSKEGIQFSVLFRCNMEIIVPFGLCRSSKEGFVGCEVRVICPIGTMSIYGLIGEVVKVVCVECHPPSVTAT